MNDIQDIKFNLDPLKDSILQNLRDGICQVEFLKKDGSKRLMVCTLSKDIIPTGSLPTTLPVNPPLVEEQVPAQLTDQIRVFDIEAQGWRSFTLAGFIGINPQYTGAITE